MKKLLLSIVLFTLSISCFAQSTSNWEAFDFSKNQTGEVEKLAHGFRINSIKNDNNILTLSNTTFFGLLLYSFKNLNCSFCNITLINKYNQKETFEMQLMEFNPLIYNILDKPRFLKFISSGNFYFIINNISYSFKPLNNISSFVKKYDLSYWQKNDPLWNKIFPSLNISYSQNSFNIFPNNSYSSLMVAQPGKTDKALSIFLNDNHFSCGENCLIKINTSSGSFNIEAFNFSDTMNEKYSYVVIPNPDYLMNKIKSLNQNNPTFSITVPTIEKGNLTFKFNISEYAL